MAEPTPPQGELTHLDAHGRAHMVDVSAKESTRRVATAQARVRMTPATLRLVAAGELTKGDALAVARLAGIMAAKETPRLIPLCHSIALSRVTVDIELIEADGVALIHTRCEAVDRTGVEMEALVAASVAALTLYDMAKAVDRGMVIEEVRLLTKEGGRSGPWHAAPPPDSAPEQGR